MTKSFSVPLFLPSRIGPGKFSLNVIDGGNILDLSAIFPPYLLNVETMHKKWLPQNEDLQIFHQRIIGFKTALKRLPKLCFDKFESINRILLQFPIPVDLITKYKIAWKIEILKRSMYI